jgi:ABC-2 type transport system permease protein
MAYRTSFVLTALGNLAATGLDFLTIVLMFAHIHALGGFTLPEVALLYGATSTSFGIADLTLGSMDRLGRRVRDGTLDVLLLRPAPVLAQVAADRFALRRLGRITQAAVVFAWGAGHVDWSVPKVLVALVMCVSASAIFFALFVGVSCIQFWTTDASEFANAFTYGGNTLTQYPLTIFPVEVVKSLTFVLPIAFVNWYPCLYLLDREDPFGMPGWFAVAPPFVAVALLALAALAWRTGVRRYTSTGS